VVHAAPHVIDVGLSAKPFIDDGGLPPLKRLFFAHCGPQNVTVLAVVAERSPTTKAPAPVGASTVTLEEAPAAR
jgi:hypothetical protein